MVLPSHALVLSERFEKIALWKEEQLNQEIVKNHSENWFLELLLLLFNIFRPPSHPLLGAPMQLGCTQ